MIYLGSLLVFILSFFLFRFAAGNLSLTRPHLIAIVFYRDFILMAFVGVFFISTSFDLNNGLSWWGTTGHVHEQARFNGWLSTMYTMLAFPIGMILANLLILQKFSSKKILLKYYEKPFAPLLSNKESAVFLSLCAALLVSFLAIIYTFYTIQNFPLLHLIKGADSFTLAQMRIAASRNVNTIASIRDVLMINLTLFLSLTCYAYFLLYKRGKFKFLFYVSLVLAFIALTYNLEKAPVFLYFLSIFSIYVVYKKGISFGKLVFYMSPLIVIVFLTYAVLTGTSKQVEDFVFRVFIAQSVAIFQGFEYFPSVHDFIGFNGISRFYSYLVGGELLNSGRVLFEIFAPAAIEDGTAGVIVGLFNAEAWMLFGLPGVLVFPIYVGFFVQALNIYFLKSKKTPIYIAMYVYFWTKLALAGSLAQFLYPIMIVSILVLFWFLIYFSRMIMAQRGSDCKV